MREDQQKRLDDLAERLAEVFIVEADPDNWSGAGMLPNQMDRDTRGNRHWDRKGAMGTGGVLRYTLDLLTHWKEKGAQSDSDQQEMQRDADLDKRIEDAERRAERAMKRAMNRAKTSALTNGKAAR